MLPASSGVVKQILSSGSTAGILWGAAARHLDAVSRQASSCSGSRTASPSHSTQWLSEQQQQQQQQHQEGTQQQQQQQQQLHQHQQPYEQQPQQPATPVGWLQQLYNASTQERLSALSRLTVSLQGHVTEWTAPSLLPRAALAAVTTAAAAAMAPAGASLASFQGSRYTGSSSVTPHGDYWLRQMGLDGSKVTALLVATNVGCFGMQQLSTTFTSYCVRVGFKVAEGEYWRLLTAAFVHGGLLHVGINTLALWNMGRMIEPLLGSKPFLTVYLGSAISGNLLGYWMSTGFASSMGSSSALFGLLGAYLASSYINRGSVHVSRAQVVSVLQTLGINLAIMTLFGGYMDNWAHLGGFAGGALIGAVVGPRYSR